MHLNVLPYLALNRLYQRSPILLRIYEDSMNRH